MALLAGVDLGTSSLKVSVMDEAGTVRALAFRHYRFASPVNGWCEQWAREWWQAAQECLLQATADLGGEPVKGVGFSGQMHGVVFLDEHYREIRPAILHCDARSGKQVARICETLGDGRVRQLLSNPVYTGFMLPSLLWLRDNEPDNFARLARVCSPKDYLRLMLTGEYGSDYSDASATLCFDIGGMDWSEEVLSAFGLSRTLFPPCAGTDEVVGAVTQQAAALTGLAAGTPVVAGGADQVMQAIGNGVILPGQATVNIGTSGQVAYQTDRAVQNPALNTNTFCAYARGRWYTMGATMAAGLSLKWWREFFPDSSFEQLDREAAQVPAGSGGMLYLPYLTGERTPHLDPDISGVLLGLTPNSRRGRMSRAIMEGVCYSLRECMELCGTLGLASDVYVASGGGAKSPVWLQIQADVYGVPLRVADVQEHASTGAAIAAGVGAGVYRDIAEGCRCAIRYSDVLYTPNAEAHAVYNAYFALYKQSYQDVAGVLHRLTALGRQDA